MRDKDRDLNAEILREVLDEDRRDPYDKVQCISCMDDPLLCHQLGVCDEDCDLDDRFALV